MLLPVVQAILPQQRTKKEAAIEPLLLIQ